MPKNFLVEQKLHKRNANDDVDFVREASVGIVLSESGRVGGRGEGGRGEGRG